MKCRNCKYMKNIEETELYECDNPNSQNFGAFTGPLCEDECEDGEDLDES